MLKDNFTTNVSTTIVNNQNGSSAARKSSYSNSTSMAQNNMFKRMRQTGSGHNISGNQPASRYSNTSHAMRNLQIDKRLNELKNSSSNQNGSFVANKYQNRHSLAHEQNMKSQGAGMTSTMNKSGQNLNNNFQKSSKNQTTLQSQRNGTGFAQNTASVPGSTTGRSSMSKQLSKNLMQPAVMQSITNQSS